MTAAGRRPLIFDRSFEPGYFGAIVPPKRVDRMSDSTTTMSAREKIEDVLASVRPAIRSDGGDVEFVDYDEEEGLVKVRMVGACYACPMSMLTLKAGIEQRLRMQVPGVRSVEAI